MPQVSDNVKKVISMLENSKLLAVRHHRLNLSIDVISACHIYSKSINLPVEDALFDDLKEIVRGKNNLEMAAGFDNAEREILFKTF